MKHWIFWATLIALAAVAAVVGVVLLDPAGGGDTDTGRTQAVLSGEDHADILARLEAAGYDTQTDTDGDRLPDVLENYVYGSDPEAFSTTGNGIPDGWFSRYGYDPTEAGVASRPAAVPPASALPDVYGGHWPDKYRWTLGEAYRHGMPVDSNGTFWDNGIDPRQWEATPGGLPVAWLVYHAPEGGMQEWDVADPALPGRSLTGDGFAVRDNYKHGTDPLIADTDGDGLQDSLEVRRYGTDPNQFSSSGGGVPDGWLVHHQLDPLNPAVGSLDPAGKGMDVAEVWRYNRDRYGTAEALGGEGLDPTEMSHRGDAVPDGWLLEHGLDPFEAGVTQGVGHCASDYADVRNLTAEGNLEAIPDLCLNVQEAYLHGRPDSWSEADDGPWPGGLDPASGDQDGDGLPDAVELRGWYIQRVMDMGPDAQAEWIHVRSDPLIADTDGDGLLDAEEYAGEAERDGTVHLFPVTDPSNPDTAFSGLTDAEKIFATIGGEAFPLHEEAAGGALRPLLDPTKRDTAGDFLADGAAMAFWIQASENALAEVPYDQVYLGSGHKTYLDWINGLEWVEGELTSPEAAAALAPQGDIDGDGVPNIVDAFASGDAIRNGWQVDPSTLRFSDLPAPTTGRPRDPIDPANPDTDGDGLLDGWELRHGIWSESLGEDENVAGWDLDPADRDSDSDGVPDGKENMDGDVVRWYSYSGDTPFENTWEYNNEREAKAGTDPRDRDETRDGVTEGWVTFWFERYPQWISIIKNDPDNRDGIPEDEDPGDRIPTTEDIDAVHKEVGDLASTGERAKDEFRYYRFMILPDEDPDPSLLGSDESYVDGWPKRIEIAGGTSQYIALIAGTHLHTHADDQIWGLNPYMEDTDGDGMRDAWEAYYGSQAGCGETLDPASPEADDADGDSLIDATEYNLGVGNGDFGPSPCLADTDLDGIEDADEVFLPGRNPVLPEDKGVGTGIDDTDGDGLLDFDEVRGSHPTDPADPDTDGDGLLDGTDLPERDDTKWQESEAPSGLSWPEEYKALGIAHRTVACSENHQDRNHCFFGEVTNQGDARESDSIIAGIEDGWSTYYQLTSGSDRADEFRFRYHCNQPSWWDTSLMGVWWWGLPATGPADCPRDRDHDGLDDLNGEDPVPAASQSNHAAAIDLPGIAANNSKGRLDVVRAAQAWGECAGNPEPCFDQWEDQADGLIDRVDVVFEDLVWAGEGVDVGSRAVTKETDFVVTGRLIADCGEPLCPGAPNRTVVVRLAGSEDPLAYDATDGSVQDGAILGVAFTDGTGDFTISNCLCANPRSIDVPPGYVALGHSNTTATWVSQAADIPVGSQWALGLHAYASSATFWGNDRDSQTHPQYLQIDGQPVATSSNWTARPGMFTVTSDTTLDLEAPSQIAWGDQRVLQATVKLRDASGGVAGDQTIVVTASRGALSLTQTTTTDSSGRGTVAFPLDDAHIGPWTIEAAFDGNTTVGWRASTADSVTTTLQAPLRLEVPGAPPSVRLGEPSTFTVHAITAGSTAIGGIEVNANLGGLSNKATTDGDGRASITFTPAGMEPGPANVTFHVAATPSYTAAQATQPVSLVSGSVLHATVPETGSLDAPLSLSGRLVLADGTPMPGEKIHAMLAGKDLGRFTTDRNGRFDAAPMIPLDVGIGTHTLQISYDGMPGVDAASSEKTVRFSVGTLLTLEDMHSGRGQVATLVGGLVDVTGHPLVGEAVNVTLPWNETVTVLARSGGNFTHTVAVPSDHALGVFRIDASYAGSRNGTFGASTTSALLEISSPSRIETDPVGTLHRGNNTVTGRLLDDETDAPIQDAPIQVTSSVGDPVAVRTDDEGGFRLRLPVPRTVPGGAVDLTFRFDGDERYAPAENTTSGMLRVPVRLSLSAPPELGRATSHPLDLLLTDDRGEPLADRNVTLAALGSQWNLTTDGEGRATHTLHVPADAALGGTALHASFDGDAAHDPAQVTREPVVKDGVRFTVDGLPDEVRPGQRITLRIHVEDTAGRPVETPVAVHVAGLPGSILTQTDDIGRAEAAFVVPDAGTDALRVTVRFPGTDLLASRTEALEPTLAQAPRQEAAGGDGWPWGLTAAVAVAAAVVAAVVVAMRRRRSTGTDILEEAQERISAGDPWTDAVLDAYRRMGELVKDYGISEDGSQTGRAFAQTLVQAGFLGERAAIRLVALFERARYADGPLRKRDAVEARRVLEATLRSVHRAEAQRADGGVPA